VELYKYNPFAEKLNRPDFSYRAVNEMAYKDLLDSGVVRGRAAAVPMTPSGVSNLSQLIGNRPTAFPSFERGKVLTSYLPKTGQGFIYETDIPMVRRGELNPITGETIRGRHFAARPISPITGDVLSEIPASAVKVYEGKPNWLMGYKEVGSATKGVEAGRNLLPAARQLGAALGAEVASVGGMALRGAGRLAGPVGVAMTAYDAATIGPAMARDWLDRPTYISDPNAQEKMASQALIEYRTGPQPRY
jgi:hypothetical protein